MRLVSSLVTGFILFGITMLVYGIGLSFGLCTASPQLVGIVAINDLMVAAVLWMFWD